MHTDKTSRKNATFDERAKLALHKCRHIAVMLALTGEERFEMSGNDSTQRIFFGIARPVDVLDCHGDMAVCKPQRIRSHNRDSNLRLVVHEKIRQDRDNGSRLSGIQRYLP